jgi:hypothetical protein
MSNWNPVQERPITVPWAMLEDEEGRLGDDYGERQREILREHWNRTVCTLDNGAGYERLHMMREQLQQRREEIRAALEGEERRIEFAKQIMSFFTVTALCCSEEQAARSRELKATILREGRRGTPKYMYRIPHDVTERALDARMWDSLQGENGLTTFPLKDRLGWHLSFGARFGGDDRPFSRDELSVSYDPPPEKMEAWGFEEGEVDLSITYGFDGRTTWREAVAKLHERAAPFREHAQRLRQTDALHKFRLDVIAGVLYRFDVHGEVRAMDDDASAAAEAVADDLVSSGAEPTMQPAPDGTSELHHQRTVNAGLAILRHRAEHEGADPEECSIDKTHFCRWAGERMAEAESRSAAFSARTALDAFKGAGCYDTEGTLNRGTSRGLKSSVEAVANYARQYADPAEVPPGLQTEVE